MKKFDFYEFTGILTPGVILLYAVSLKFPAVTPFMSSQQLSVGDLGLFIVLAYVAGHLVQSLGNLVEWLFWKPFGGMPSNWVIGGRTPAYLNPDQVAALPAKVEQIHGWKLGKPLQDITNKEWAPVVRSIYVAVQREGRDLFYITQNQAGNVILEGTDQGIEVFVENVSFARTFDNFDESRTHFGCYYIGLVPKPVKQQAAV